MSYNKLNKKKNRIKILPILLFITLSHPAISQKAKINEGPMTLLTYPYFLPDPVPQTGRIYPYFRFDGYSAIPVNQEWNVVKLENDFIEVYITPEIGGKIWGAIDKSTGKEFIYFNHSVKFRDIAMRGPWTSGGIELNFGLIGHGPTCSSPVDYYLHEFDDGSVSCFIGAIDLPSRTEWRVEVNLHPDRSYFTTHALWLNPTPQEQSYYHWMNGAVKASGNLEFSYPGTAFIGHNGVASSWPENSNGRNLSFYEKNNFGSYKSYHVLGEYTNFFGGYWHDDEFGFGHYSNYDDKPGKKIWIWGLSRQGMIWEELLTDTDDQYVEIQSGRLFNQEAATSTYTPFKHRGFKPHSADLWTEHWFPVIKTKGLDQATQNASVNIEKVNDSLHVWICSNTYFRDTISLLSESERIFKKFETLSPTKTAYFSFPFIGNPEKVSVKLGQQYIIGPGGKTAQALSRPLEMPDFDWKSVYGLYLAGKEKFRQRYYTEAEILFQDCLAKDQNYLPALNGLAQVKLHHLEYQKAWELVCNALSIDTYDPEANFYYGITSLKTGKITDAKDGFSIAAASIDFRCGSYTELAKIYFREGDLNKALEYAHKSMLYNRLNLPGLELIALIYRKLELYNDAAATLIELLNIDPLNHFGRFERYLPKSCEIAQDRLGSLIRNELPQETYLETALKYFDLTCNQEAIQVLERSPEHPMVLYWIGYLNKLSGRPASAIQYLEKANEHSPNLVFPFREESVEVLKWAIESSSSWKPKYYLALIYWNRDKLDLSSSLLADCGNEPDFPPFYLARGDFYSKSDYNLALNSYLLAIEMDPQAWKAGFKVINFYTSNDRTMEALKLSENYSQRFPENFYLGLQYASLLNQTQRYDKCIGLLKNLNVLPNEGATSGRNIWREANLRYAIQELMNNQFSAAAEHIKLAKKWPENLGVGKPYDVDERLEDFLALMVSRHSELKADEEALEKRIAGHPVKSDPDGLDFITACILKGLHRYEEADEIMSRFNVDSSDYGVQWYQAVYKGDQMLAKKILTESSTSPDRISDLTLDLLILLDRKFHIFKNSSRNKP